MLNCNQIAANHKYLADAFGADFIKALVSATNTYFTQGNEQRNNGFSGWWKKHEAALLALGRFPEEMIANGHSSIDQLLSDVIESDRKCFTCPFLQGRTLWFTSKFASIVSFDIGKLYLMGCVEALTLPSVEMPARVFAIKALLEFLDFEDFRPVAKLYQSVIIQSLCQMADSARGDALILLLGVLTLAVKVWRCVP